MRTLFKTVVGSKLYGLALPDSDTDYRGFGMPDVSMIIGLNRQEEDISKNLNDNTESSIFSLSKYLHLLMKGNPTVLEIAFADPKFHVQTTPEGLDIVDFVKKNFVTKHLFKPYNAYFRAQMHELNNTQRTGKRLELVQKYGYDTKFASHALRLGYQCIELMKTGNLDPTLQGSERELVFSIKTGCLKKNEVMDILNDVDKQMYTAYQNTTLPAHPNFDSVNKLCIEYYFRYLQKELS